MIRKLMASCAVAALMSAGVTFAQAQTEPATPAVTQDTAAAPDNTTNAAPSTEVAASEDVLTQEQPTLATSFMGKSVYSSADPESDNIGDVNDLIVSENGEITHAIVGVGGFLGIGEKNVAVPFDELQVVERDGDLRLVYAATREQLEAAPAFDRTAYDPAQRAVETTSTAATDTTVAPTAGSDATGADAPAVVVPPDQAAAPAAEAPAEGAPADTQMAADTTAAPAGDQSADAAMTQTADATAPNLNDFVQKVGISNLFEIQSSEMARDKAQNEDVKAFAQRMIDDHTKAGDEFRSVVQSANAGATMPDALDEAHQAKLDELTSASADDFDRKYVDMQVQAHDEAVSLFQAYAEKGDNEQVKQFAAKMLPTLQDHQKMIKDISDGLSAGGMAAATGADEQQTAAAPALDEQPTAASPATPAATTPPPASETTAAETTAAEEQTAAAPATTDMTAAPAAGDEPFVSASTDQIRASTLIGKSVYGPDDASIGEISDLVLQKDSGARVALIDVGGFLGMGEKTVAIPFQDLQISAVASPAVDPAVGTDTTTATETAAPAPSTTAANDATGGANTTGAESYGTGADADLRIMVSMTKDQLEQLPEYQMETDAAATDTTPATPPAADTTAAAPDATTTPPASDMAAAPDAATPETDQITTGSVSASQDVAATKLMGARVYGTDDADLGEVSDIVFDKEGQIDAVIVDVGGFLGIGEKPVAMNFDMLNMRTDEAGNLSIAVNATKEQLDQAPAYQVTVQ